MIEQSVPSSPSLPRSGRRVLSVLITIVVLTALGIALYRTARLGWTAWQAYQSIHDLAAIAQTEPVLAAMPAAQAELQHLAQNLSELQQELQPWTPLLRQLRAVPRYGPTIAAAPELLDTGRQSVDLAEESLAILAPALARTQASAGGSSLDLLAATLNETGSQLPALAPKMQRVQQALAALPSDILPSQLAGRLSQAPGVLALGSIGAQLGPSLPWLLGMDAPRTYLILVQNNHELRATGGFITAVGKLTLDKGKIVALDVVDSYDLFRGDGTYAPAPPPMQRYMNIPILVMRDSNWFPDLPTTAQVAQAIYAHETGEQTDGIITVDLNAVKHMVGALGTLDVPGADAPITAENIEQQIVSFWEKPPGTDATIEKAGLGAWWSQRKDFVPAMTQAAMERIQSGSVSMVDLAAAAQAALEDRSIQVWVDEKNAQQVLANAGWDGGLHPEEGADFLAVVDTNMGYNKVDAAIQRALDYRVAWPDGAEQPAQATLTLTYTHPIDAEDPGCDPTPRYGTTYADMIARCYFDYVRVYAPAGSKLIETEGPGARDDHEQTWRARHPAFRGIFHPAPTLPPPDLVHIRASSGPHPRRLQTDSAAPVRLRGAACHPERGRNGLCRDISRRSAGV